MERSRVPQGRVNDPNNPIHPKKGPSAQCVSSDLLNATLIFFVWVCVCGPGIQPDSEILLLGLF